MGDSIPAMGGVSVSNTIPATSNDPVEYFTSFEDEETGTYFLDLIPWIDSPGATADEAPQQSDIQALSGTYSARMYTEFKSFWKGEVAEDLWTYSELRTKQLPIPTGADSVTVALWYWARWWDVSLDYELQLDGSTVATGSLEISRAEAETWKRATVSIKVGTARRFKCRLQFATRSGHYVGYDMFVDNLSIDFHLALPAYVPKLIHTDMKGAVYGVSQQTGTRVWSFQCAHGWVRSAPAVVDGSAYFADGGTGTQSSMYSVNADTGGSNWTMPMSGSCATTPQFDSAGTYVATSAGLLYGFNALTGTQLFTPIDFMGLGSGKYAGVNGMVLVDGVAYLSTEDAVYAVSLAKQAVLWHCPTYEIPWEVAVSNGSVYAGCVNGSLYCVDASTGRRNDAFGMNGKFNSAGAINCSPVVVGGVVIVGCDGGVLYGLDALTGAQLWSLPFTGAMVRSFAVFTGRLYVIASAISATCYAYDVAITGTQWSFTQAWTFAFTVGADMPLVQEGSTVYFTANNKNVYALSVVDGAEEWAYSSGTIGFTQPSIVYFDPVTTRNRGYNQYCYLTAHNAFASWAEGWLVAQQLNDIPAQLNDGVRGLMLDVYTQQVNGVDTIVFCHGSCTASYLIQPFVAWPRLADALAQIKIFLDNNPTEVVTIFFEQRVKANVALFKQTFEKSGLWNYLFLAGQTDQGTSPNGQPVTWSVATQGWPTLSWMAANNKRLVLFSDWGWGTGGTKDFCPLTWDYAVENQYGNKSLQGGCEARDESQPLNSTARALFIMNYFPTVDVPDVDVLIFQNDYYRIMPICSTCTGLATRPPNFLAVDYYQLGQSGGPRAVVAQLNALWAQTST